MPPPEAKSNQAPDSGLFESSGTRGYTAGGPLSEKWSEIFPQEQSRRGVRLDDKSWTSYLRFLLPALYKIALLRLPPLCVAVLSSVAALDTVALLMLLLLAVQLCVVAWATSSGRQADIPE